MHSIIERAISAGNCSLNTIDAGELLGGAGICVVATRLAASGAEAVAAARELGFPVALKIASAAILHKTDAGGIRLGLETAAQVKTIYRAITDEARIRYPAAPLDGVYVQPMAPPGVEVIIGMKKDKQFGPVLMFGLGGIWVEVLEDVSLRVAPISRRDAAEMVREIKGYPLLAGYRGREPVNTGCLEGMLLALDALARENPEIREIDLNPVVAGKNGAVVVDARVVLETES